MRCLVGNWDHDSPWRREQFGWGSCRNYGPKRPMESKVIIDHTNTMDD